MTTWTNEELDKIGIAEELRIASLRRDGTLRKPIIRENVQVLPASLPEYQLEEE